VQFICQIGSKSISYVFIRLEIAEESNHLRKDKKLHNPGVTFPAPQPRVSNCSSVLLSADLSDTFFEAKGTQGG